MIIAHIILISSFLCDEIHRIDISVSEPNAISVPGTLFGVGASVDDCLNRNDAMRCDRAHQDAGKWRYWRPAVVTSTPYSLNISENEVIPSGCKITHKTSPQCTYLDGGYVRSEAAGECKMWAEAENGVRSDVLRMKSIDAPHTSTQPSIYTTFEHPPSRLSEVTFSVNDVDDFTYYKVHGSTSSYTGIQWHLTGGKFLFSAWGNSDCSILPEIHEDPFSICREPLEGQAEGCHNQCYSEFNWKRGVKYTFQMRFYRMKGKSGKDGIRETLTVRDESNGGTKFYVALWTPNTNLPQSVSSFIEQFAGDTLSCTSSLPRSITFHQVRYFNEKAQKWRDITHNALISRPYDLSYGRGSMCQTHGAKHVDGGLYVWNGQHPELDGTFALFSDVKCVGPRGVTSHWRKNAYGEVVCDDGDERVLFTKHDNVIEDQCEYLTDALPSENGSCIDACTAQNNCNVANFADGKCFLKRCGHGAPRSSVLKRNGKSMESAVH